MNRIEIWTDGGCEPNPGFGGWAAVIIGDDGDKAEMFGHASNTTNQRMELTAPIAALELMPTDIPIVVHSDSKYVVDGIRLWVPGWKANGWQRGTARKPQPVANLDLWKRLEEVASARMVTWQWVKGHAGNEWNERADELAGLARLEGVRQAAVTA